MFASNSVNGESKKALHIPSVVQLHLNKLKNDIIDTYLPLHLTYGKDECEDGLNRVILKAAKHYFQQNGKLFRPMVCLTMAGACNQTKSLSSNIDTITENQYKISIVTEMIHTASLIHDDVLDKSDQRRNQPSVNAIWGNKRAILVGDLTMTKTIQLLANIGDVQAIDLFAKAYEHLVTGEFMQLEDTNSVDLRCKTNTDERFEQYMIKTFKKTASLFAHSCKAIALITGCDNIQQQASFEYGRHVGLAFQLMDDLLDFMAKASDIGKPVATDLKLGLATAPVLFAAREYKELDDMILRRFCESGDVDKAWELVVNSDGLKRTKELVEHHVKEAIKHVNSMSNISDDFRQGLITAAQVQLTREK